MVRLAGVIAVWKKNCRMRVPNGHLVGRQGVETLFWIRCQPLFQNTALQLVMSRVENRKTYISKRGIAH